ncbi:MAG: type III-A CRISPR-associated protein Csm2 [Candidatus Caldatribacteriaceae bacterium]
MNKVLNFENMPPGDFKVFNEKLKSFVLKRKEINPTRIRKVYEIIRTAEDLPSSLLALPKLAYMVGKEENEKRRKDLGVLYQLFSESIKKAENEQDLQGIRKFAEALVAYHNFYASNC